MQQMSTGLVDVVKRLTGVLYTEAAEEHDNHARTNYVLVDFENVQPGNLDALHGGPFKIVVFLGTNQKPTWEVVNAVQPFGADGRYIKISGNGKHALDFHIAYYVGRLAAESPDAYFHIISKDTGYDPLIEHLKELKIHCKRSASISEIPILRQRPHPAVTPVTKPRPSASVTVVPEPTLCAAPVDAEPDAIIPKKPATQPTPAKTSPTPKPKPVAAVIKHLAKSTKPRTEKTLKSAIKGVLGSESTDQKISSVVRELQARGIITIKDGKISNYKLPS
jgi:hypothetical protein